MRSLATRQALELDFTHSYLDDKPCGLQGEMKPYQYRQWQLADLGSMPFAVEMLYKKVLYTAAELMRGQNTPLGNVWLRFIQYEVKESFGSHVDPSFLSFNAEQNPYKYWYGQLAKELEDLEPRRHVFNPRKSLEPFWIAFVYPAMTLPLPKGGTVADFVNNLGE